MLLKKRGGNQTFNKKGRQEDEGCHRWLTPCRHCNFKKDGNPHRNRSCKSK